MRRVFAVSAGRPRLVLACWALLLLACLYFGRAPLEHLHETDLRLSGTPAARYFDQSDRQFGGRLSMTVLLKGPTDTLDARGPVLVDRLEQIPGVTVLSPWARAGRRTLRTLRQPTGQAQIALQVNRSPHVIYSEVTPAVERELKRTVTPPLQSDLVGLGPIVRAANRDSLEVTKIGELIALPVLMVLLLLVFRSPVAALVPGIAGLLATRVGAAAMIGINEFTPLDGFGVTAVTVIGLALGVDYSLLMVSRFREELAATDDVHEAVRATVEKAGHTVYVAASVLIGALAVVLLILGGGMLGSMILGALVAGVVAMLTALFAMPAALMLLGPNVNRWMIGRKQPRRTMAGASSRVLRRPLLAALLVGVPLLVLSIPALGLETGPTDVNDLLPNNPVKRQFEDFERVRGLGWATPYEVAFTASGPITTPKRLAAIERFQRRAARLDGVRSVVGPATLKGPALALQALAQQSVSGRNDLRRLANGLRRALSGTGRLRDGLGDAASGADLLASGLGRAHAGSAALAGAAGQAAPGADALASGVEQTNSGAGRLSAGATRADTGATQLGDAASELSRTLAQQSGDANAKLNQPLDQAQLTAAFALRSLSDASAAAGEDPAVQQARQQLESITNQLATTARDLNDYTSEVSTSSAAAERISASTKRLVQGIGQLADGSRRLAAGTGKTADGSRRLAQGVQLFSGGTQQLSAGLLTLLDGPDGSGGAEALAAGLNRAVAGTDALGVGAQRLSDRVIEVRNSTEAGVRRLRENGADLTRASRSGYLLLAGIDKSEPQTRSNASFIVGLPSGGSAVRVLVIPRQNPLGQGRAEIRSPLEHEVARTARELGGQGVVGGEPVLLDDFHIYADGRTPLIIVALLIVSFVVLTFFFRAPALALCAVLLNAVTVFAAIGVLVLLFQGDPPLMGGSGYIKSVAMAVIIAVVFALSIDYEVFLISRLLEGRALTGTTEGAIHHALTKTSTIITGAAFIMAGVFLSFSIPDLSVLRQLGLGLTFAVLVDGTVVRLVLFPATVKLLGERAWVTPRLLARRSMRAETAKV